MATETFGDLLDASSSLDDSEKLAALFDRDGYLLLRGVLDLAEVERAKRDLVEELQRQGAIVANVSNLSWTGLGLDEINGDELYAFNSYRVLSESITTRDIFEKIFNCSVHIFRSTAIRYSLPNDDIHITPAHQDNFTIGPNSDFRTAWIPLMTIDQTVGGLCLARASHKNGLREHVEVDAESYVVPGRRQIGVPLESVSERWLTTTYRPGDLLIFHSHTIHRALPNNSNEIRLSLDTRVQPATSPRSFHAIHTISEQREYRKKVHRIAVEEGAGEHQFEVILHDMTMNGLTPDRAIIKRLLTDLPLSR